MPSTSSEARVLVTGAGGPAAVAVLRALAPRAELYAVDIDPCAAGLHLVDVHRRAIVRPGEHPLFVDELIEHCRMWDIDVLIPTVDCELVPVAAATGCFAAIGTSAVVGPAEALAICLDKWRLAGAATSVPAPFTVLLDDRFDDDSFPSWPAIVKPRLGSGSRGVCRIEHPSELAGVRHDGTQILQEYLPGEELSVDVYVDADQRPIGAVPRQRLRVDSGVSIAGRTVHDPDATDLAFDVVQALGLTGPANVQCRRDRSGRLALLEINPRFPGALPLTIRAGFNIAAIALDEALGTPPTPLTSYDEVAVVRHLEDVVVSPQSFDELERSRPHSPETWAS